MTIAPESTFAFLSVVDAYKWWINSDFGILQATGILDANGIRTNRPTGTFDLQTMRQIARAYTVNRNIPAHNNDAAGQAVVDALCAPETAKWLESPFPERAERLADFVKANTVALAPNEKGEVLNHELASAYSKLSWFLRPEDWTIFDKYVGAAVLRREQAGLDQMNSYYAALAPRWRQTSAALIEAVERQGLPGQLGYRIADKYLFYQGIGMYEPDLRKSGKPFDKLNPRTTTDQRLLSPAVQASLASLTATERVLSQHMGDSLRRLAEDVAPILSASQWIQDPA